MPAPDYDSDYDDVSSDAPEEAIVCQEAPTRPGPDYHNWAASMAAMPDRCPTDVGDWTADGESFVIRSKSRFVAEVLVHMTRGTAKPNWEAFKKQCNNYSFSVVGSAGEMVTLTNKAHFVRGRPELMWNIVSRRKRKAVCREAPMVKGVCDEVISLKRHVLALEKGLAAVQEELTGVRNGIEATVERLVGEALAARPHLSIDTSMGPEVLSRTPSFMEKGATPAQSPLTSPRDMTVCGTTPRDMGYFADFAEIKDLLGRATPIQSSPAQTPSNSPRGLKRASSFGAPTGSGKRPHVNDAVTRMIQEAASVLVGTQAMAM